MRCIYYAYIMHICIICRLVSLKLHYIATDCMLIDLGRWVTTSSLINWRKNEFAQPNFCNDKKLTHVHIRHCPKLLELSLKGSGKVGDESVEDIATCSKLRLLDIQVLKFRLWKIIATHHKNSYIIAILLFLNSFYLPGHPDHREWASRNHWKVPSTVLGEKFGLFWAENSIFLKFDFPHANCKLQL